MEIKIVVTREKFDELFSIDDWLNLQGLSNKEAYDYMLMFVVNDEGQPIPVEEARRLFKKIPKKEWAAYIAKFITAVRDAFVNPTTGNDSGSQLKVAEPESLPDGSPS